MNETVQIAIASPDKQLTEQLIARLSLLDFDAFEERDNDLLAFIDLKKFDEVALQLLLSVYGVNYVKTIIEEQNWNALWESSFEPVVVGDFCAIRADFHQPFTGIQHEIIITPKMSFGTGHHATTYLMISEMSKINFKNKKVADFGTGTGVLAILAEKLGSNYIWANDIDDWSIENATENSEKNGCNNIIIKKTDSFNIAEKFDVILANINKNVILANAEFLAEGIRPLGKLLLSGLLKEDENEVVAAFLERGIHHKSTVEKNNWICLLLEDGLNIKEEY